MTRQELAAQYPGWQFHEVASGNQYGPPIPLEEWAGAHPERPVYRNRGEGAVWLHPDPEFAGCFGKITPPPPPGDRPPARQARAGGRSAAAKSGRCALCREPLGNPSDGMITLIYAQGGRGGSAFRLACRDRRACQSRQKARFGNVRPLNAPPLPDEILITLPPGGARAVTKETPDES